MDEQNNDFSALNKASKLLGLFSIVFVVVDLIAVNFGKHLPDWFYKLIPSFIGGTALTGLLVGIWFLKNNKEEQNKVLLGLGLNSIGIFAALCLISN